MIREASNKEGSDLLRPSLRMLRLYAASVFGTDIKPGTPESAIQYEKQGEDEFKILGIGSAGAEKLHNYLETENYVLSFDGTITDEYFELKNDSAVKVFGDWPRIRHRVGKRHNKKTGEMEAVDEFVFTLKSVAVRPGERTEHANLAFKAADYGEGEAGVASAHAAAVAAMHAFIERNFPGQKGSDTTLWSVWKKHRTSHAGHFTVDEDGKAYGIKEDTDTQESRVVIFQEDSVLTNEERIQILALYTQAGLRAPGIFLANGSVTIPAGYRLEIPLSGVAAYAEFEVTFPVVDENDSEEVKRRKEKIKSNLVAKRNALVDYLRKEGIVDPSLGISRGDLDVVLKHHNVPDVGMKKSSREVFERRRAKNNPAEASARAPVVEKEDTESPDERIRKLQRIRRR